MPILSSEKPRYFKIHFMENNEELLAEGASVEPQKKRTRITKKEVSDHVYSVTGDKGENLDQPKKKRTRKTKAEKEAEAAAAAAAAAAEEVAEETAVAAEPEQVVETQDVQNVQETVEKTEETVEAEAPVKRKRGRKSKEDIMAAAAAAAAALAMKSQDAQSEEFAEERPSVPEQQTINFEEEAPEGTLDGAVPEEMYQKQEGGDEETTNLLEQLQNKVNTSHAEGVWEGDPNDGTDFIIVEDIPVEDNGAIPYYDMFDNPQVANDDVIGDVEEDTEEDSAVDFNDIITANGLLEIMPDGYGFLRSSDYNYLSSPDDVHLNVQQIKQYSLKTGDVVECKVRPPHCGEKYFTMSSITKVNGRNPLDVS